MFHCDVSANMPLHGKDVAPDYNYTCVQGYDFLLVGRTGMLLWSYMGIQLQDRN